MSQRSKVIGLYKQLLYLSKDYPNGPEKFRKQVHDAFSKNKNVADEKRITALIAQGKYVVKEMEALMHLKKYRFLKKYSNEK